MRWGEACLRDVSGEEPTISVCLPVARRQWEGRERTRVSRAELTKIHPKTPSFQHLTSLPFRYVQSLLARINLLEQQVRQKGDDCHRNSPNPTPSTALATDGRGVSSSSVPPSSIGDTRSHLRESPLTFKTSPPTIPSQHDASPVNAMGAAVPARMVNDSLNVNKQYYGQSSIVSLLRQASRDRTRTENSQYVETQQAREARHIPSTTPTTKSASIGLLHDQFCLPPRRVADSLLEVYWKEAHIFHPWVHFDSFMASYRSIWSGDDLEEASNLPDIGLGGSNCPATVFYCALNAMLAEACQFSDIPPQDKRSNSKMFYDRARALLQVDLLDSGSLSHIQTLLLVVQYLQCTELATQCWNLVGMAYRMSVAIGLHHEEESAGLSSLEREMRRRTWHACLQMEL